MLPAVSAPCYIGFYSHLLLMRGSPDLMRLVRLDLLLEQDDGFLERVESLVLEADLVRDLRVLVVALVVALCQRQVVAVIIQHALLHQLDVVVLQT